MSVGAPFFVTFAGDFRRYTYRGRVAPFPTLFVYKALFTKKGEFLGVKRVKALDFYMVSAQTSFYKLAIQKDLAQEKEGELVTVPPGVDMDFLDQMDVD